VKPDQVPIALPRSSPSNDALMMARLPGVSSAPPSPCTARATTSASRDGASPHAIDARANTTVPMANTRRRPKWSPSDPPTRINAASIRLYASTTHCTPSTLACSSRCSTGSATFTTVVSMNTMLDPRIVAASTHGPEPSRHRPSARLPRMLSSSHGSFRTVAIPEA
jgi:hypothetical protein